MIRRHLESPLRFSKVDDFLKVTRARLLRVLELIDTTITPIIPNTMSTYNRGTKRSADSAPSGGRNFKSAKSGGGGGGGYKGGKGGKPGFNKGGNGKPGFNKGGSGKPGFNKGGKPEWNNKGKGKAAAPREQREREDKEPARRKRPVTQGGGEEDAMSVDGDDDEFDGDEFDMEDDGDVAMGGNGEGQEEGAPEKRGKMTKAEREALHAQQPHRRTLLPSHGLLTETLLPLWETARRAEMPKEERKAAITELYEAVKGRVLEISRGHKGGRVLQTVSKPVLSRMLTTRLSSTEERRSAPALRWSCSRSGAR